MTNVQSIPSPSIHSEDRAQEADNPSSPVAKFGMDQPLKLDCGIDLAPFQVAYQTYGELNADRSNAILVLPCADRRPACPQRAPGHGQAWLVGHDARCGPAARHRQVFHHLLERDRRLHGLDRAASINSATGKLWGLDFPVITIPDMCARRPC